MFALLSLFEGFLDDRVSDFVTSKKREKKYMKFLNTNVLVFRFLASTMNIIFDGKRFFSLFSSFYYEGYVIIALFAHGRRNVGRFGKRENK